MVQLISCGSNKLIINLLRNGFQMFANLLSGQLDGLVV